MKILLLMPCDEQHVYLAGAVYNALPKDVQEKTFPMPLYMDYVMESKITKNWTEAFFYAQLSADKIYKANEQMDEDLIIIGNTSRTHSFDAVFNLQEEEETLEYKDLFAEKLAEIVHANGDDPVLTSYAADLHEAHESILGLRNAVASADFLTNYLKADRAKDIEKLKKEYIARLKELGVMDHELSAIK